MNIRVHISEDGRPRRCNAEEGRCPLKIDDGDGAPAHGEFESLKAAEKFAEEVNSRRYGGGSSFAQPLSTNDVMEARRQQAFSELRSLIFDIQDVKREFYRAADNIELGEDEELKWNLDDVPNVYLDSKMADILEINSHDVDDSLAYYVGNYTSDEIEKLPYYPQVQKMEDIQQRISTWKKKHKGVSFSEPFDRNDPEVIERAKEKAKNVQLLKEWNDRVVELDRTIGEEASKELGLKDWKTGENIVENRRKLEQNLREVKEHEERLEKEYAQKYGDRWDGEVYYGDDIEYQLLNSSRAISSLKKSLELSAYPAPQFTDKEIETAFHEGRAGSLMHNYRNHSSGELNFAMTDPEIASKASEELKERRELIAEYSAKTGVVTKKQATETISQLEEFVAREESNLAQTSDSANDSENIIQGVKRVNRARKLIEGLRRVTPWLS